MHAVPAPWIAHGLAAATLIGVASFGALALVAGVTSSSSTRGHASANAQPATFAGSDGYVAFSRAGRGIFLADPDSGGERRLAVTVLAGVACSREGSWLAFNRARGDSHRGDDIYRVAASGGRAKRLTHTRGLAETVSAWSPDARRIAYGSGGVLGSSDLWVMNADGSGKRRITHRPGIEVGAAWSPGGRRIAFSVYGTRSRRGGIFVATIPGGRLSRLTRGRALVDSADWSVRNRIAYKRWRRGVSAVYAMDPDGGGNTRLASLRGSVNQIAWSPDGRRLALDLTVPGISDSTTTGIYVVEADGTGLRRLTDESADASGPVWSPDGTKIAYTRNLDVWVMNADGTAQRRLTSDPASESVHCWKPLRPRASASTPSRSSPK